MDGESVFNFKKPLDKLVNLSKGSYGWTIMDLIYSLNNDKIVIEDFNNEMAKLILE